MESRFFFFFSVLSFLLTLKKIFAKILFVFVLPLIIVLFSLSFLLNGIFCKTAANLFIDLHGVLLVLLNGQVIEVVLLYAL